MKFLKLEFNLILNFEKSYNVRARYSDGKLAVRRISKRSSNEANYQKRQRGLKKRETRREDSGNKKLDHEWTVAQNIE